MMMGEEESADERSIRGGASLPKCKGTEYEKSTEYQ